MDILVVVDTVVRVCFEIRFGQCGLLVPLDSSSLVCFSTSSEAAFGSVVSVAARVCGSVWFACAVGFFVTCFGFLSQTCFYITGCGLDTCCFFDGIDFLLLVLFWFSFLICSSVGVVLRLYNRCVNLLIGYSHAFWVALQLLEISLLGTVIYF